MSCQDHRGFTCWREQPFSNRVTDWLRLSPWDMEGNFYFCFPFKTAFFFFLSSLKVAGACQSLSAPPLWGNWQDAMETRQQLHMSLIFEFPVQSYYLEIMKLWRFEFDIAVSLLTRWLTLLSLILPKLSRFFRCRIRQDNWLSQINNWVLMKATAETSSVEGSGQFYLHQLCLLLLEEFVCRCSLQLCRTFHSKKSHRAASVPLELSGSITLMLP